MPNILIDVLKDFKDRQAIEEQDFKADLSSADALVFGNTDGTVRTYSGTKKIFQRFLKKHNLEKYNIHFHGLRHTYSNMLFEADQNPKVIQLLLGHKDVKTTISTYNSVDKSYFDKATNVLNEQFKESKTEKIVEQIEDDDIDELLELLQKKKEEQRRKRKEKDFEM